MSIGTEGLTLCTAEGYPVLGTTNEPIVFGLDRESSNFSIDEDGRFWYRNADQTITNLGVQFGIAQFNNPAGLLKLSNSLLQETEASGEEGAGEGKAESRTPGRMILDEEENKPSVFYLILAVATLLFVACTAVLTSVHYLYFEQQLDYTQQVPGLPNAK